MPVNFDLSKTTTRILTSAGLVVGGTAAAALCPSGAAVSLAAVLGGFGQSLLTSDIEKQIRSRLNAKDVLQDPDLQELAGKAIRLVIEAAVQDQPENFPRQKAAIGRLAAAMPEQWMLITQAPSWKEELNATDINQIPGLLVGFDDGVDQIEVLSPDIWFSVLVAVRYVVKEKKITDDSLKLLSKHLHKRYADAVQKLLKRDQAAFVALQLMFFKTILERLPDATAQSAQGSGVNLQSVKNGMKQLHERALEVHRSWLKKLDKAARERHQELLKGIESAISRVDQSFNAISTQLIQLEAKVDDLRELYADPRKLADELRQHINETAEQELQTAKKDGLGWLELDELTRRRDIALAQVDSVIQTVQQGLAGKPDPIFAEASRILAEEGAESVIEYLTTRQEDIVNRVDSLAAREEQLKLEKRAALEPLLLQADLHKTNLEWDKARELFELVARKEPTWFKARKDVGSLLTDIAQYAEAEPHLQAAVELSDNDNDWAAAASTLAHLLYIAGMYTDAEPLMRRALEIDEQSFGKQHPNVARDLNNLASLLKDTNRLAEAEPLMRRVVEIFEISLGEMHPNVAVAINNLALLLQDTNRLAEAEPLMRRALEIDEQSFGKEHPKVATRLNNLAWLLKDTNRLAEAEPLMRRVVEIFEISLGEMHPNVAVAINNLALLLQDTNRLAEAEPLMRRALEIFESSLGSEHPNTHIVSKNYRRLLEEMDYSEEEIEARIREVLSDSDE